MQDPNRPISGVGVADLWTFKTEPSIGDVDLTGFKVEATDGSIGKVDEATYEIGSSYLVIDTGPWIFGKKVMLPAGVVQQVDPESETVFVNRAKDEIKNAPEFDDTIADAEYRNQLGDYYGAGGTYSRGEQVGEGGQVGRSGVGPDDQFTR
jgi:hypothetical protein